MKRQPGDDEGQCVDGERREKELDMPVGHLRAQFELEVQDERQDAGRDNDRHIGQRVQDADRRFELAAPPGHRTDPEPATQPGEQTHSHPDPLSPASG